MNLKATGVVASICVLLASCIVFADAWIPLFYNVHPPMPEYPAPRDLAEAQRDDLDYLRNITRLDRSYTQETRAAANAIIDRARSGALPLSKGTFELVIARVLATADNGHTNVRGGSTANRLNRLPIRLYSFSDGVFVVRALPQAAALLGARIVAIDGRPIEAVRAALAPFTGGTQSEKNVRLPFYLESPELLQAAGLTTHCCGVVLTVVDSKGTERTASLDSLPPDAAAPKIWPSEELRPVPNPGEDRAWIAALAGKADALPLFARAPRAFFAGPLRDIDGYYVRFDTNDDDQGVSVGAFADQAMKTILAARPRIVVIDLRMNGGGDYTRTARFMRKLPIRLAGARFYVLLSQETFSSGMTDAAFLSQAGGGRVIFVGDLPGDRMRFYSEGSDFCLPYSKICVTARTAIHDYSMRWCRPLFACYPLDLFYPVAIGSFTPQLHAPLTYRALASGHDPALDAIVMRERDIADRRQSSP
jgi:hypothetical protein